MKKIILSFIFLIVGGYGQKYFQQDVSYNIDVKLNDSLHTLSGYEKITYINNSNETLDYLWFHIWPNAYKSDSSALAKQFIRLGNTKFKYTKEKNRGFIDSLDFSIDGIKAEWEYHIEWNDVIKINLPEPLKPKEKILIETPFFVKLPKIISRLGHNGQHYEITQWYPKPAVYDINGWHPMPYLNMGEFYSEFGTFDVKITLPKKYRIMATGDLVGGATEIAWLDSLAKVGDALNGLRSKEFKKAVKKLQKEIKQKNKQEKQIGNKDQKYKTLHFRQENIHDFAWFADPNWIVQKGNLVLQDSDREVILWSMYLPKNAKLWKSSIQYLHDSGYWYSKFYGNYPYNHITAVDGDMSAGGGMEYPNITVISRSGSEDLLEFVIMHEVGHNWFYGILGNNERDHTWLDEGLNEYSNIRYWEKKYKNRNDRIIINDFIQNKLGIGRGFDVHFFHYIQSISNPYSLDLQPLNISADENYNYVNYGQNYNRVAIMMRYLQHYLGEEKMDIIMKDFYETWKFKHPGVDDFYSAFEKHTGNDLTSFFENVFDKTSFIDFEIKKENGDFIVENKGTFNTPIEIAYYNKNRREIQREWIEFDGKRKEVKSPKSATYAIIDPDNIMPDVFRVNNSTKRNLSFNFIFEKPTYHNIDLNIMPWFFSYNTFNGFTPGLTIWNGFLPGYNGQSSYMNLLYDFKNKTPLGGFGYNKNYNQFLNFHSGSWGFNASNISGRDGFKVSFKGLIKQPLTNTPKINLNLKLFYHNLNEDALDTNFYDAGEYLIGSVFLNKQWQPNIFRKYSIGTKFDFNHKFLKSTFRTGFDFKISKNIRTNVSMGYHSFLISKKIPKQFKNYLFGSVDPNFEQLVFNRTQENNDLKILEKMYYGDGMRGVDVENYGLSNKQSRWLIKIDQGLPVLPGKLFFDVSGGDDLKENYYSAFGMVLGPFIVPLFQSWETENTFPNDIQWILERIRFRLNLDIRLGN